MNGLTKVLVLSNVVPDESPQNPFLHLMVASLNARGIRVESCSFGRLRRPGTDVLHLQWPERYFCRPRLWDAIKGVVRLLGILNVARRHRVAVVLTVHNLQAHRIRHPRLERLAWDGLMRRIDGCVHMSHDAMSQAIARYPSLASARHVVILHPTYPVESALISRTEARQQLAIENDVRMLLYFGLLRRYKGVLQLIDAFRELDDPAVRLVIAGDAHERGYTDEIKQRIEGDSRVTLIDRWLDDAEVRRLLAACNVVALPFERVLNSGSLMYALSVARPAVVPNAGSLAELATIVGDEWVTTYPIGHLDAAVLAVALEKYADSEPMQPSAVLPNWNAAAESLHDFYASVSLHAEAGP